MSLNPEISTLGTTIFSSSNALLESTRKSNAHGLIEDIIIYKWPTGVSTDNKLKLLSLFTTFGRSESESHSKWQTWVLSFSVLCFEEFETKIRQEGNREMTFKSLPMETVTSGVTLFDMMADFDEDDDEYMDKYRSACNTFHQPPKFPEVDPTPEYFQPDIALCSTIPALYGYNSLLLFMAGKKMTDLNQRAMTDARPDAIIRTYKVEGGSYILKGDGKIDPKNYQWINLCWTKSQAAKKAIFTEAAAFAKPSSTAQEVTYTTVKMVEFVGMQPAFYIHKFLLAVPWCHEISIVRPAINKYHESLREIARQPSYLQPYYKMIYGESTKAFHRQALLPLTACAIAYERTINPTLANYTMGEGADAAVMAFDTEAKQKGHATQFGPSNQMREE